MTDHNLDYWLQKFSRTSPIESQYRIQRIQLVADRMGLRDYHAPIIIVSGTNGKGSTVACLESMFIESGYIPGSYTNPYLVDYNEMIRIKSEPICYDMIFNAFKQIEKARLKDSKKITLSGPEFQVLAAAWCFRETNAFPWIFEVGIGGADDATCCFDADIGIITKIDLDHGNKQGHTRESVGYHEASIVRSNIPIVCSDSDPPTSIFNVVSEHDASLYQLGNNYQYHQNNDNTWNYYNNAISLENLPKPYWLDKDSISNAAGAVTAVSGIHSKVKLSENAIRLGLKNAKIDGRQQIVEINGFKWLLDVAHNPSAVNLLVKKIMDKYNHGKKRIVFACRKDKDLHGIIYKLTPVINEWFLVDINDSGFYDVSSIKNILETNESKCIGTGTINESYDVLESNYINGDLNIVAGSFYTVGQFMKDRINEE